jgi:hypothetical protein
MYNFCAVFLHFLSGIFNVSPRAPIAAGISHEVNVNIPVTGECAVPVSQRSETLSTGTPAVTVTNYDTNFCFLLHVISSFPKV